MVENRSESVSMPAQLCDYFYIRALAKRLLGKCEEAAVLYEKHSGYFKYE